MTAKSAEVLAVMSAALDAMPADVRPTELVNRDRAARILDALAQAGMTVTLPQVPNRVVPETEDENGRQEWVAPIGDVVVFGDGETRLYSGTNTSPSPAEMRSFADALYSAAAAAEAGAR